MEKGEANDTVWIFRKLLERVQMFAPFCIFHSRLILVNTHRQQSGRNEVPKLIELKTAAAAEQQQQMIFSLDILTHREEQWKEKAFVSKMV